MRVVAPALLVLGGMSCPAQAQGIDAGDVDAFALEILESIQPRSILEGIEYCGVLGFDAAGDLVASRPMPGEIDACDVEMPDDLAVVASYHTHGSYAPDADTEVPSTGDMLGDFEAGVDGYVATPGGRVWLISFEDRAALLLCGPRCIEWDGDFRECMAALPAEAYTLDSLRAREAGESIDC